MLYSVCPPLMKLLYKYNASITCYEILYWKSLSMMLFNYLYTRSHGVFVMDVPRKYHCIMIARGLLGFTGIVGMWGAVKYIPVSVSSCMILTSPIWSTLYAYIFLKETISKYHVLSMISAFIGVLFINNPFEKNNKVASDDNNEEQNYLYGTIYALGGAIIGGFIPLCMRYMREGIHYSVAPFWFSIGCTYLSPIFYGFTNNVDTSDT